MPGQFLTTSCRGREPIIASQERYKHSVPQIPSMDLFRLPKGLGLDPNAAAQGYRERINVSFSSPSRRSHPATDSPPLTSPVCR